MRGGAKAADSAKSRVSVALAPQMLVQLVVCL
jgi:hypothetical protein